MLIMMRVQRLLWIVPIYVDEVLPGDTFSLSCTAFGRMATPIFPIMDRYIGTPGVYR